MESASVPASDALYADRVAGALGFAPAVATAAEAITRFGDEYGFVFKLLPVWRVVVEGPPGAPAVHAYVDAADARLSTAITGIDRLEGRSFAHLHKWEWLKHLVGQGPRDVASMLAGTGLALLTLLGVTLALRGPRRARSAS